MGEEDHLRIMCMEKGSILNKVFDRLKVWDPGAAASLSLHFRVYLIWHSLYTNVRNTQGA